MVHPLRFGPWAAERKEDGNLIASIGLFTAWRGLDPEFGEEPEMGWIFAAETHGKGMASEGCRAVLDWTEANLHPRRSGRSLRLRTNLH